MVARSTVPIDPFVMAPPILDLAHRKDPAKEECASSMSHPRTSVAQRSSASATLVLLAVAATCWVTLWQANSTAAADMMVSLGPFLASWVLMMAAMMLPAVTPVVRLYDRAAAAGRVAPTGYFVLGYLAVWTASGLPAYLLWRAMSMPLMDAETWAMRAAGGTLLAAGVYQVLPLKRACLRHCRSPMSHFLRQGLALNRPVAAARSGAMHGAYCFGCCVGLMIVLVAAAGMQPWLAAVLAGAIFVERNVRRGDLFSFLLAATLIVMGGVIVIEPSLLSSFI